MNCHTLLAELYRSSIRIYVESYKVKKGRKLSSAKLSSTQKSGNKISASDKRGEETNQTLTLSICSSLKKLIYFDFNLNLLLSALFSRPASYGCLGILYVRTYVIMCYLGAFCICQILALILVVSERCPVFCQHRPDSLTPHVVVGTLHHSHPEALRRRRSQSTRSFQD